MHIDRTGSFVAFVVALVLTLTGCSIWNRNPASESETLTPTAASQKATVSFEILLPKSATGNASSSPQILPSVINATATFRLILVNAQNTASPTTTLQQSVSVDATGRAQVTFTQIPVQTAVGKIQIAGGNIGGSSDFRGALDLIAGANTIVVAASGSKALPDVVSQVIENLLVNPGQFSLAPRQLAAAISSSVATLDLNSASVYDTATTNFFASIVGTTVTIGTTTGSPIKQLLGMNAGPLAASTQVSGDFTSAFQGIGIKAIRTHDFLIYPSSVPSAGPSYPGPLDMSTLYYDRTKDPALQASYNLTLSDQHFAAIVNGGFEVFFRLGDSAGLTLPPLPAERPNWVQASIQVLKHYSQGQWSGFTGSVNEVEIWNEPDSSGFWNRSRDEFLSLYVETATAVRAAFPTLRIGGAGFTQGFASGQSSGWMTAFLDKIQTTGAPLDFLSFHIYSNDPDAPASQATVLRAALNARGLSSTKLYLTEWNTSTGIASLTEKRALRAGAKGGSILTAGWIGFQDAPIDKLFFYRGSDPNLNTPEDYGLYLGNGTPKRSAAIFQLWSRLAGTQARRSTSVSSGSAMRALAGSDTNGKPVILVVNTAAASTTWAPVDTTGVALTGSFSTVTVSDDAAAAVSSTTSSFPLSIPAYGVQVITPAN